MKFCDFSVIIPLALACATVSACDDGHGATLLDDGASLATDVGSDSDAAAADTGETVTPDSAADAGADTGGPADLVSGPDVVVDAPSQPDVAAPDSADTSTTDAQADAVDIPILAGSCGTKVGSIQICADYFDVPADGLAGLKSSCAKRSGVWLDTACPAVGKVAGCSKTTAGVHIVSWYYNASVATQQEPKCAQSGGTWLLP